MSSRRRRRWPSRPGPSRARDRAGLGAVPRVVTSLDSADNALALAFDAPIVTLRGTGSHWIMADSDANRMPTGDLMTFQAQY